MSKRYTIALATALIFTSAVNVAKTQVVVDPVAQPVLAWEAHDHGTLTPGAPFVIYAGDRWGNPVLLLEAGRVPVPGNGYQDLVLEIPQVQTDLYLQSGETTILLAADPSSDPRVEGFRGQLDRGRSQIRATAGDRSFRRIRWQRPLHLADPLDPGLESVAGRSGTGPVQSRSGLEIHNSIYDNPNFVAQPGGGTSFTQVRGGITNGGSGMGFGRFGKGPPTRADAVSAVPGRPGTGPVQPRDGLVAQRFPANMVQPGGATSFTQTQDGALVNGGSGMGFGRFGKAPPRDQDPGGLLRDAPFFGRWDVPPGSGPVLSDGPALTCIVVMIDGELVCMHVFIGSQGLHTSFTGAN